MQKARQTKQTFRRPNANSSDVFSYSNPEDESNRDAPESSAAAQRAFDRVETHRRLSDALANKVRNSKVPIPKHPSMPTVTKLPGKLLGTSPTSSPSGARIQAQRPMKSGSASVHARCEF
ncbi:MAG: hypothetical protein JO353_06085 [Phycisphaerae bacterium]|nr:hypothetical protein [Phycisphaerae bacterium]